MGTDGTRSEGCRVKADRLEGYIRSDQTLVGDPNRARLWCPADHAPKALWLIPGLTSCQAVVSPRIHEPDNTASRWPSSASHVRELSQCTIPKRSFFPVQWDALRWSAIMICHVKEATWHANSDITVKGAGGSTYNVQLPGIVLRVLGKMYQAKWVMVKDSAQTCTQGC